MKIRKYHIIALAAILIFALFLGCIYIITSQRIYPEGGIWYCEDLQMYINFDYAGISKAIVDGEEIDCEANYMSDSLYITVERLYHESTPENRIMFPGEYVSLKGNELVLRNRYTKVEYVFVQQE